MLGFEDVQPFHDREGAKLINMNLPIDDSFAQKVVDGAVSILNEEKGNESI